MGRGLHEIGAAFVFLGTLLSVVGFALRPGAWTFVASAGGILLGGWGLLLLLWLR